MFQTLFKTFANVCGIFKTFQLCEYSATCFIFWSRWTFCHQSICFNFTVFTDCFPKSFRNFANSGWHLLNFAEKSIKEFIRCSSDVHQFVMLANGWLNWSHCYLREALPGSHSGPQRSQCPAEHTKSSSCFARNCTSLRINVGTNCVTFPFACLTLLERKEPPASLPSTDSCLKRKVCFFMILQYFKNISKVE